MEKSREAVEREKSGGGISRRNVMKSFLAAGAASALYGCGGNSTEYVAPDYTNIDPDPAPPKIMEEVVAGSAPHNCGGNCLTKTYVRGGVIKRISTDEWPEKYLSAPKHSEEYGDFIQNRNCPRCRATKSWIYGTNRLMYPLIQMKERGDLSGFRRVTWEQAAEYFKAKNDYVRTTWGPAHFIQNSSAWGMENIRNPNTYMGRDGSVFAYRNNYSSPGFQFLNAMVGTEGGSPPAGDNWFHILKSDELLLWGANFSENTQSEQCGWYLKQMKECGKRVTMIEPRFNSTSISISDRHLPVIAGTDAALSCAIMYCMLKEYRNDLYKLWGVQGEADKDKALRQTIGKYIYGFFDSNDDDNAAGTNNSYRTNINSDPNWQKFRVPAGASFSAYIMGNEPEPCNRGKSIYPEDVGYSTTPPELMPNMLADNPDIPKTDRLHGARVAIYGQVPKTPEWAERITGMKADDIRGIARDLLTKNVTVMLGGGLQRNSESDHTLWATFILLYFAKCFGIAGRNFGIARQRGSNVSNGINAHRWSSGISVTSAAPEGGTFRNTITNGAIHSGATTAAGYPVLEPGYLDSTKANLSSTSRLGDTHALTFPAYGATDAATIGMVNWSDYVEASHSSNTYDDPAGLRGTVKPTRWGNAQVQGCYSPVKVLYHTFCGGMLTGSPDPNHGVAMFTSKDSTCVNNGIAVAGTDIKMNPNGYKIEFIWGFDCVMTPQCRWSDLILPGTSAFERFQIGNGGRNNDKKAIFTHKAVNPPGECLPEMAMAGEFAKAYGLEDQYFGSYKGAGTNIFEKAWDFEYKAWDARFREPDLTTPRTTLPKPSMVFGQGEKWPRYLPSEGLTSMKAWAPIGIFKNYEDLMDLPIPPVRDSEFMNDPANNPRSTASGRVDAFSPVIMECFETRFFSNYDKDDGVRLTVNLYSKKSEADGKQNWKRIVYPIPMYIPIIEGIHACDDEDANYRTYGGIDLRHPNPMNFDTSYGGDGKNKGWNNQVASWHPFIRAHSSRNSVPLLNELKYWKRDRYGKPSFINRKLTNYNAGADHHDLKDTDTGAPSVWQNDVYETAWINPNTKYADGSSIQEGDVVVVESLRGKMLVSAHLSQRVPERLVALAQGCWYDPIKTVNHGVVDRGGCMNTVITRRGSRVNQSCVMSSDTRARLEKYIPHPDDEN